MFLFLGLTAASHAIHTYTHVQKSPKHLLLAASRIVFFLVAMRALLSEDN